MTTIHEIATWYALSPLAPWFWVRLTVFVGVATLLAWWVFRTPQERRLESRAKRLAATRQTLAKAVRAISVTDPRAPAKFTQAIRTLLDTLYHTKTFRSATAAEIARRISHPQINAFFKAAQRPLYAPDGITSPAEIENFKIATLEIIETYQPHDSQPK